MAQDKPCTATIGVWSYSILRRCQASLDDSHWLQIRNAASCNGAAGGDRDCAQTCGVQKLGGWQHSAAGSCAEESEMTGCRVRETASCSE